MNKYEETCRERLLGPLHGRASPSHSPTAATESCVCIMVSYAASTRGDPPSNWLHPANYCQHLPPLRNTNQHKAHSFSGRATLPGEVAITATFTTYSEFRSLDPHRGCISSPHSANECPVTRSGIEVGGDVMHEGTYACGSRRSVP